MWNHDVLWVSLWWYLGLIFIKLIFHCLVDVFKISGIDYVCGYIGGLEEWTWAKY